MKWLVCGTMDEGEWMCCLSTHMRIRWREKNKKK
jgi:hypothetical protein